MFTDESIGGSKHALPRTAISEVEGIEDNQQKALLETILPKEPTHDKSEVGVLSEDRTTASDKIDEHA